MSVSKTMRLFLSLFVSVHSFMYSGSPLWLHDSGSLYHGLELARRQVTSSWVNNRKYQYDLGAEKRNALSTLTSVSSSICSVFTLLLGEPQLLLTRPLNLARVVLPPTQHQHQHIDSLAAPRNNEHKQS